jgi:predicted nucleotidyltransferase
MSNFSAIRQELKGRIQRMECAQENYTWKITPEKVDAVIRKIVEICRPVKLILFGSYVRGVLNVNSDLDVLIVSRDDIENPRKESVRIRRELRGILMPMDIIVVGQSQWETLKDVYGLVYREAAVNGRVVYEAG